jgi:glycosyltransferase involved in cell wall biosynthesis
MLANLAPHKGQETAIRAVSALRARGTDVSLWLAGVERAGSCTHTEALQRLIGDLGVGELVSFLGHRDDAPDLLRAADAFLLPSTREGLPLSILEAQATGTPVVAAPTAGVPEVVADGETGFLVPATDVAGYADRIDSLLRNRAVRDRVVQAALTRTQRYHTWSAYCRRIEELYREVQHTTA